MGGGLVGGHGPKGLASSPAEKRAAAKAIQDHIESQTRKAGARADEETAAAVKAFGARDGDGWLTSAALRKAHETWGGQVKNLMDRLGAEKDALGSTNTVLTSTDLAVGSTVRQMSALDRY
ncbi:hypothetical protein BEK98_07030 [Streptomyces diastatochromogenes]|uniref:Uncharacterized protein n=1 Tax=Streptomyces diastatochromogenes TaxID=42236 RepID=A0A233ST82_STRDA|nr:hypothetical protein [Streptomyces diastatochromogenes]OXY98851.1 hypothetical protein BEK98_07030 [Streptomyces diastatochromogenes]